MNNRLELVDFLKGFSIFTIVVMHLAQYYAEGLISKALSFGGAGVHVFILCSGFGLYLSHLRRPLSYTSFLKRRFTKVYVPYAIVVLVSALIPFYYAEPGKWQAVLSHLFLYKMFFPELNETMGAHLWFISTIVQFYLCWPLAIRLFECKNCLWIAVAISFLWATIVTFWGFNNERVWNSFFLQYLWEFVLGMWLAKKYTESGKEVSLPSWWIIGIVAAVCMAITGYMGFKGGILKSYNDAPSLFAYLSCALFVYKIKIVNAFFKMINKFSYELYLVHILVFACLREFITNYELRITNYELRITIILLSSIVLSLIVAYLYSNLLKKLNLK